MAQPAVCNTTKHGRNGIRAMPKNFVTCNSFCVYIFTYIVHNSLLLLKQFEKKKKTVFLLENTIQHFAPLIQHSRRYSVIVMTHQLTRRVREKALMC